MDTNSENDLNVLNKLDQSWQRQLIVKDIIKNFIDFHNRKRFYEEGHFFVLTTQDEGFENLDESKILGITEVNKMHSTNSITIENLQVNPNTKYRELFRKYKYVGAELVNFIKSHFSEKEITLYALRTAIPFYEKLGFKRIKDSINMVLER